MNREKQGTTGEYEIDLTKLFKVLFSHIITITAVTLAGIVLGYFATRFVIKPKYTAHVKLYVNNINTNKSSTVISSSEITAAKALVDTYTVILKTEPTLEKIIDKAGLSCDTNELAGMISAKSVNDTEIFEVDVTNHSPEVAQRTAEAIAEILPDSISSLVDGSSVRIVEHAKLPVKPSSPNLRKNILLGGVGALLLILAFYVIRFLTDTNIHSEDDLRDYFDIPVLGVIPDMEKLV